jgi:hypothetical protein
MTVAGFCRSCGQYVYLNEQWGCVNGHPWTDISNWYDPTTGAPVTPYWLQAAPAEAAAPAAAVAPAAPAAAEAPAAPVAAAPAAAAPVAQAVPAVPVAPMMPVGGTMPTAPVMPPVEAAVPVAAAVVATPEPAVVAQPAPAAAQAASDRLTLLADLLAVLGQYPAYNAQYGVDTDVVILDRVPAGVASAYQGAAKAVEDETTLYLWEWVAPAEPGAVWDFGTTRAIVWDVAGKHGWKVVDVTDRTGAQW